MLTLIIGGARSGKSDLAQRLAAGAPSGVLFIATMLPGDDETRRRVAAHRAARPASWTTIEAPDDPGAAIEAHAAAGTCVVIDCLTLWTSNLLLAAAGEGTDVPADRGAAAVAGIVRRGAALADRAAAHDGDVIAVTNEVGLGVVPATPLGRLFQDALGGVNRAFARRAGRVYSLTAGLALDVTELGARPLETLGG
ncbi:MAG TPA: bifunctional adenosylcobinamide kinase/adenosylcobinamide-phosphate guanylyltransferase [Dehalococcoidia bacterium]|nr:bifunctional adenosylcobinamide kinase/adenosylcobinamide-phosphate guanylyltransferase [Dehalococcoidia bacterium]